MSVCPHRFDGLAVTAWVCKNFYKYFYILLLRALSQVTQPAPQLTTSALPYNTHLQFLDALLQLAPGRLFMGSHLTSLAFQLRADTRHSLLTLCVQTMIGKCCLPVLLRSTGDGRP